MEGDSGGRPRRRRPQKPQREVQSSTIAAMDAPPNPSAHGDPPAPQNAQPSENGSNKRSRGKRVRKPRGSSTSQSTTQQRDADGGAPTERVEGALTWQQEHMLSINAPAFQPTSSSAASGVPLEEEQGIGAAGGGGKSRKSRKPRKARDAQDRGALQPQTGLGVEDDVLNRVEENDVGENSGAPMCLLCCAPMKLCSFGPCNHRAACGRCCLRMRMCYGNIDCPLCKAELKEVVIAPWRASIPDFAFYTANPDTCARTPKNQLGPGTVFIDRWVSDRQPPRSRLLHDLIRSTGIACSLCDPAGKNLFLRFGQLDAHLKEQHGGRCVCLMCLNEGRSFPLDAEIYSSSAALKEHASSAHPRCSFCRGAAFFDGDALWSHMMDRHFRCQLCEPPPGGDYPWYNTGADLQLHLSADHFACEEAECAQSLVAFVTADELRRHHIERHSTRMPRWNQATSRPLHLDIQFVRRPGEGSGRGENAGGFGAGRGRGSRRQNAAPHGDVRMNDGPHAQRAQRAAPPSSRRQGYAREVEGGVHVIDDDLGMQHGWQDHAFMGGSWAGRRSAAGNPGEGGPAEQFPSLAAAAAEVVASDDAPVPRRRPPPLVKRTVRCPCGRRVTHSVVEEGQDVPPLVCDALCNLEGRRAQLADAFGVEDPSHHVSAFERRAAEWSGALLAAAKRNKAWVEGIERELAAFIANKTLKRHVMAPMPRAQRVLVHGIAEQYGLATASTGQDLTRGVELFKTGNNIALPNRLLSRIAPTVGDDEIAKLLKAAEGYPIKFVEIAPTADLHYYLRRWDGKFSVEWKGGSEATVRFDEEADRTEALDSFGGGIRGLFRIDRQWHPRTAVEAAGGGGGDAAAGRSGVEKSRGWGYGTAAGPQQEQDSSGSGVGAPLWVASASVSGSGLGERETSGSASVDTGEQSNGPSVPSGWTIMGGKQAVKPRVVGSSSGGGGSGVSEQAKKMNGLNLNDAS